jgi:hypothetical protein
MSAPWLDVDEHPPTEPGWYAVVYFFDHHEGFVYGTEKLFGGLPLPTSVIFRSPMAFETDEQAKAWAYAPEQDMER